MTIAELMTGQDEMLICGPGFPEQSLGLRRIGDRIDLVDLVCNDTGSDLSSWTTDELAAEIENWIVCVTGDCAPDQIDDAREDLRNSVSIS